MNTTLRGKLLLEPPAFHRWDGAAKTGGFDGPLLEFIERSITGAGTLDGVAFETGAGLTSVWLLCIGLREVHSFCHNPATCKRIADYLLPFPEERHRWRCHVGFSEVTLPPVALATQTEIADFCLIDGGHGLHQVFNDFVYLNYVLKPGGLLAIDDLQIGSCRLLSELLTQAGAGYERIDGTPKLAVLRKVTEHRLLSVWDCQKRLCDRLSHWLGDSE